ncbi:MAG TPA: gliding motility-associated C-terminal domain-containing protein [Chitinophagaceae bacterium]|nr:gliding motility-associated C-terminal domain-containing protein [Chitinophagaceae bacterium]
MNRRCRIGFLFIFIVTCFQNSVNGQACTTLGQTPSTAFPVCGTTTFSQSIVPICSTNDIYVPGCSGNSNANYQNKNPFFYKFTCYVGGTLGFIINPHAANDDYDWQLYDITGHNPDDIFTDYSLVVTGNWSGSYGTTGAAASGVNYIQCASVPADNAPRFAAMPVLTAGRDYLLMISHFTDTQSGYDLIFKDGTAVITDPKIPKMLSAKVDCDGKVITLQLNKQIQCNSVSGDGSEFSISPSVGSVVSATAQNCTNSFDFTEMTIILANPVPNGTFDLVINNGTDGNTLLDICGNNIAENDKVPFTYNVPQPIFADSIGKTNCAPDSVKIYFPKKINCASIAANGSDFSVTGPTPVNVIGAYGNCTNGKTPYVVVRFAAPIFTKGNYQLHLKAGNDGTVLIDECGLETPVQSLGFTTEDTVNADFSNVQHLGCEENTVAFSHNGAHDVNTWIWTFNNGNPVTGQTQTKVFPAKSSNTILLIVSNGTCTDTSSVVLDFDNEVNAGFSIPSIICPEDPLTVVNTSTGLIDEWLWKYDAIGTSTAKDPPPFQFPMMNNEAYYTVTLIARNNTLGCEDTAHQSLTVLDNCLIAVPNAFTPNHDGRNDYFRPHNALKADKYDFKVFNRWGQLVFHTNDWQDKWDGNFKGSPQGAGVFVWMLRYTKPDTQEEVFQKGTVMLIR